ncbi:hypothetical protein ACQ4WX_07385 [Streptomyces lasalocidi]
MRSSAASTSLGRAGQLDLDRRLLPHRGAAPVDPPHGLLAAHTQRPAGGTQHGNGEGQGVQGVHGDGVAAGHGGGRPARVDVEPRQGPVLGHEHVVQGHGVAAGPAHAHREPGVPHDDVRPRHREEPHLGATVGARPAVGYGGAGEDPVREAHPADVPPLAGQPPATGGRLGLAGRA